MNLKALSIAGLFLVSTPVLADGAKKQTCDYKVDGMDCAACTSTIKVAVRKLKGVDKVSVSFDDKKAEVTFDPAQTSSKAVEEQISSTGYKATLNQCKA